ncbi:MAG: glycosyltransferase family 39 protein [Anaerolineales bacterium]|nr:glycosyltransferase family 39 protein [Anaerolineales bacterium]
MHRKPDLPALLLLAALLFGVIVRVYPAMANGFPLNDGGMFLVMTQDLRANGFALPDFTTYNNAEIPFAYPPLGFYVAALLSTLVPGSDLSIFLYLPAFIASLAIPAFYLFTRQFSSSRVVAAIATLIYALEPRSFLWLVMGGGITRSFGVVFLLLMLWQALQLFKEYRFHKLILTILFGAAAVVSHPQTGFHAALGGLLIFLFQGRNKRGILSAFLVALGVGILTSPWWLIVLQRHGLDTFLSAGQTSQRSLEFYLIVLKLHLPSNIPAIPFLILFYIGLLVSFRERNFIYIVWIISAYLSDLRGADGIALFPKAVLAAMGAVQVWAWIDPGKEESVKRPAVRRGLLFVGVGMLVWFVLVAVITDFRLVNTSLKAGDLAMIEWVNENSDAGKTFALATGREFSMTDPLQEWFPALTGQTSLTTLQGMEWTLAGDFFPWYEQLTEFQKCPNVACLNEWSIRNGRAYDYLIVLIPPDLAEGEMAESLRSLGLSARTSAAHVIVYESANALIFEYKK